METFQVIRLMVIFWGHIGGKIGVAGLAPRPPAAATTSVNLVVSTHPANDLGTPL